MIQDAVGSKRIGKICDKYAVVDVSVGSHDDSHKKVNGKSVRGINSHHTTPLEVRVCVCVVKKGT